MKTLFPKIFFALVAALLIIVAFMQWAYKPALEFENKASGELLETLVLITEINTLVDPLAENVPILKTYASDFEKASDKIINYLEISSILVLLQTIVLDLSRSVYLSIFMVILFIGIWIPKIALLSKRLLILCLIISPGLSIYINVVKYVAQESKFEMGTSLHQMLTETKDSINSVHEKHLAKLDTVKQHQIAKHGKLTFWDKLKDHAEKAGYKVEEVAQKVGGDVKDVIRFSGQKASQLAIELFVNIAVVFFLLPLVFWYIFTLFLKRFFLHGPQLDRLNALEQKLKDKI